MRAVLLDRDGVINENLAGYVTSWESFRFVPRALDALAVMRAAGLRLAVVTNQSAVGRGLMSEETLLDIHRRMLAACAASGAAIDALFACTHAPKDGCACRKPKPGLLHRALAALRQPPERCVLIGDSVEDLQAAQAAGMPFVLVRTGRGEETLRRVSGETRPLLVADDLWSACRALLLQRPAARAA